MNTTNSGGAFVITSSPSENWNTVSQGPYSLSFKDWRIYKNTYNFKLNDNKTDILTRIELFKNNIQTLKDVKNTLIRKRGKANEYINILNRYWPNDSWNNDNSAFFEYQKQELIDMAPYPLVQNRTRLFIPWNIHFILIKDFRYDIKKGHVTFEPDNEGITNSAVCRLSGKVHYGLEPRSKFYGFWADNNEDLDMFLSCNWATRNLIRAYIYFKKEIEKIPRNKMYFDLYNESRKDAIDNAIPDDDHKHYEKEMKLDEREISMLKRGIAHEPEPASESEPEAEPEPMAEPEPADEIIEPDFTTVNSYKTTPTDFKEQETHIRRDEIERQLVEDLLNSEYVAPTVAPTFAPTVAPIMVGDDIINNALNFINLKAKDIYIDRLPTNLKNDENDEKKIKSKKKKEKQRHKRLLSDFLKIFDFTESTMESIAKAEIGSVKQMITNIQKLEGIVTKDETNGDDIDRYNNFITSLYKNRSELNELIGDVEKVQTLILNGISSRNDLKKYIEKINSSPKEDKPKMISKIGISNNYYKNLLREFKIKRKK